MTSTTTLKPAETAETTANAAETGAGKAGGRAPDARRARRTMSGPVRAVLTGHRAPDARRTMSGPVRAVLALPALVLVGCLVWIAFINICYPLRPSLGLAAYTRDSWGGPTYAGVWAVHGSGGVVMLALAFFIARPFLRRRSR